MGAKFELNYQHEADYSNKVVVEIRLTRRPGTEVYKKMIAAINELDTIAQGYIKIPPPTKETK